MEEALTEEDDAAVEPPELASDLHHKQEVTISGAAPAGVSRQCLTLAWLLLDDC